MRSRIRNTNNFGKDSIGHGVGGGGCSDVYVGGACGISSSNEERDGGTRGR